VDHALLKLVDANVESFETLDFRSFAAAVAARVGMSVLAAGSGVEDEGVSMPSSGVPVRG
jgi:hypothetical protein